MGKARGAARRGGGEGKAPLSCILAPSPVHELQVFLLEAAVLLAVRSRVLLQLRHSLLQKDHLHDGRGEHQLPVLKHAGKAAPSALGLPWFVALIQNWSP